jgi:hypothetical protein
MSDNAPTLRLPTTPPPPAPPSAPPGRPPGRPSRGPMVAFILLSILVVAAIALLVYILIGRANASTQALTTPSATASSAPPAAPAPPPPSGLFTVFTVPASQDCRGPGGGPGKNRQEVDAQVTWATTNATQVWVATGSGDAAAAGVEQVPLSGNQDSFPTPLAIDCNQRSMTFTMTLVGANGADVSRTWTVMVGGRHP